MGLEIEFEYTDSQDEVWSPARHAPPLRERLGRGRAMVSPADNPILLQLGIVLAAIVLGAASMAGYLAGRTAAHGRAVTLLHLAPANAFTVSALPEPAAQTESPDQLLATPWTNTADRDVSLTVVNDGPEPVTLLGATVSSLDFGVTGLAPVAGTAPVAPGSVSLLRGRAHFVCGDYSADRTATVANLRVQTADGAIHRETLEVDRFSEIAEQSVCARMPTPQVIRSTTFSLEQPIPPGHVIGAVPNNPPIYDVKITAGNRASFPLRMALPQSAIESWAGSGRRLTAAGDAVIPPHGTGAITISVSISDCPNAIAAASGGFAYDLLAFTDGRDAASDAQVRSFGESVSITEENVIMTYCLAHGASSGSVVSR